MKRIHLFEFEDQNWCPDFIRETTTDFLSVFYNLFKIYEPAFEKIYELLDKTNIETIIDCCSGSGGPIRHLREYLDKNEKKSINIVLTDKYPNLSSFKNLEYNYPGRIIGYETSLDVRKMPFSLHGIRIFFSSFHHFSHFDAIKILQNAVDNNSPIGIFEFTQRHPIEFIRVLFSPLATLLLVPFAKKMTWRKFIFTYIFPITPFTHMWEFFVSNMRTYSPEELQKIVEQIDAPHYKWEIGKSWSKKSLSAITYLIGYRVS